LARLYITQGYQALKANDVDTARSLAYKARDLHADLDWYEPNPDRLLADIQRRAPGAATQTAQNKAPPAPTKAAPTNAAPTTAAPANAPNADPRALLKQGRDQLARNKLDEAEKLGQQAAAVPGAHWGLFEDTPEKLHLDIQKVRTRRNREESVKLLKEARTLFAQGKYQEARTRAWRAAQLHGPYSVWDLGDRPQKLLAEIDRAEINQRKTGTKGAESRPQSSAPDFRTDSVASKSGKGPKQKQEPQSAQAPMTEAKARALALLNEAKELSQRGMLVEARQRAVAACNQNAVFGAEEEGPTTFLQNLNIACYRQVDALLQRSTDTVVNINDPVRFQKAEADLAQARTLAAAFGQDVARVDQKLAWVHQVAGATGNAQIIADNSPAHIGKDKLEKARLELRAGNTRLARRLAEEAYDPRFGVQQEALALIANIDLEERNQALLTAHKNAASILESFKHRDFAVARSMLAGLDLTLLNPEMQRALREIIATPEMQPRDIQAAGAQVQTGPDGPIPSTPGKASAGDLAQGPRDGVPQAPGMDLNEFHAMEEVVFQSLHAKCREVQVEAMNLVKTGDTAGAIERLKMFNDELGRCQLDPQRRALLRRQLDSRIQQYQTLQARLLIERETKHIGGHDEKSHQIGILKNQEEVADLMKQYRLLMKEGKLKEALAMAHKAQELDADNPALQAAVYVTTIRINQKEWDDNKAVNEELFLRELNNDWVRGYPTWKNPVAIDKDRLEQTRKRPNTASGIWSQNRNAIERDIERKLNRPVPPLNFKDTPLRQAISDLQTLSGVNIYLDQEALRDTGVGVDQPLSLNVEGISLKSALNLLLKQVHLTYLIKDEVLQITTENNAKGRLRQVTYPVADLIVPVENQNAPSIYSLEEALQRHVNNSSGQATPQGMTPYPGPMSLGAGQTVSSAGSGLGGFAAQNSSGSPQISISKQTTNQTIEETLIDLITKTVAPDSWNNLGGPGTIQYFPIGMALVINQTQDVQEQIYELLAALRRLQDLEVAIEMRMVSVSEAFFEFMGVNFDVNILTHNSQSAANQLVNHSFQPFGLPNSFQPNGFVSGLTPAGTFTPDLNIPLKASSFDFAVPPFGGYPGTLGADGGLSLGLAFLSDIQVFLFLEAAQGDRRTNVMQAPKITVFNGQTAFLTVGAQQFFLTGVTINQTAFGNIFFTPQNVPFPLNVTLRVTPVISADRRFVRLNLQPTMTNLASATVPLIPVQIPVPTILFGPGAASTTGPPENIFQMFFQQPTFDTISLATTVNVPDGGTVLLGGLKTLSESRNEFGPPILSKIPYLDRLFKNVGYGREAQSLMIMVTPRIIINEEEEQIFIGALPPIPRP
jgi:type II secretory pathway component GspD/PulD (secretin)